MLLTTVAIKHNALLGTAKQLLQQLKGCLCTCKANTTIISIDLYSADPDQDSNSEISDDQSSLSRSGYSEDDLSELIYVRGHPDEGECIKMQ
ncbi:hypothetical protein HK096_011452, partial [Nowakowskiella sp. JEL0078]